MPEDLSEQEFEKYFGFLEKDYGFTVSHSRNTLISEFSAKKKNCEIRFAFDLKSAKIPNVDIYYTETSPDGKVGLLDTGKYIGLNFLVTYYFSDIPEPAWYEVGIPEVSLEKMASCLKNQCVNFLQGDFNEWPKIQEWYENRNLRRRAIYEKEYKETGYEFFKQDGKSGLTFNRIPVLPTKYASIEITNQNSNDYSLSDFLNDPYVYEVNETNYPIVTADGKCGLLSGGTIVLKMEFERIVKICWNYYLCKDTEGIYQLYSIDDFQKPIAEFIYFGTLTLTAFLQELEKENPVIYSNLKKDIYQEDSTYLSRYRFYGGSQNYNTNIHHFVVAFIHVKIHDDFSISEPVKTIKP